MPCRSDYMEPQGKEIASKEVAIHLVYLLSALNERVPLTILNTSTSAYGNPDFLEPMVQTLCGLLRGLSELQLDTIVYDGRKAEARELAAWWYEHKEADAVREAREQAEAKVESLKKSGLAKLSTLTNDEIKALGLTRVMGK